MIEGRRSPRVLAQIPIQVCGEGPLCQGVTAVVNRHGALILVWGHYEMGAVIQVENLSNGDLASCRVVWDGGQEMNGQDKLGVELMEDKPDFWGVDYAAATPVASQPASQF